MTELNLTVLDTIGVTFTSTGMLFANGLSYDDWSAIGETLQRMGFAIQFAIGDWLNYGERAYGEKYAQAILDTGRSYQTLMNYAYVANKIEFYLRRENLSFSHHSAIASLEPDQQARLLDDAERGGWTVADLYDAKQELTGQEPVIHTLTCPACGHTWRE